MYCWENICRIEEHFYTLYFHIIYTFYKFFTFFAWFNIFITFHYLCINLMLMRENKWFMLSEYNMIKCDLWKHSLIIKKYTCNFCYIFYKFLKKVAHFETLNYCCLQWIHAFSLIFNCVVFPKSAYKLKENVSFIEQ